MSLKPLLFVVAAFCSTASLAQTTDNTKSTLQSSITKELAVSPEISEKVATIILNYKAGAKKLLTQNYDESTLRSKIDSLITDKNRRLAQTLTAKQYEKFVPLSERKSKLQ